MKRHHAVIAVLSLCIGLWIFLVYRSSHCLVGVLAHQVFPSALLDDFRYAVRAQWPMPGFVIFQLPGGLWVLAATIASWNLYWMIGARRLELTWVPLAVAVSFELLQGAGLTDGTCDFGDVLAAGCGFLAAKCIVHREWPPVELTFACRWRRACCLGSYGLLFLADLYR